MSGSFAAFVRAVNVGAHRKLSTLQLTSFVEERGGQSVQTILQTGNVVFHHPSTSTHRLETAFDTAAETGLGWAAQFMIRTAGQMHETLRHNPFPEMARSDPSHLVVVFLKSAPSTTVAGTLEGVRPGRERFALSGSELYVTFPDGIGRSKVSLDWMEKRLATVGTMRNWNTVTRVTQAASAREATP